MKIKKKELSPPGIEPESFEIFIFDVEIKHSKPLNYSDFFLFFLFQINHCYPLPLPFSL